MSARDWDYQVTGYNAAGEILVQTTHLGKSSMEMELAIWRRRIARKDDWAHRVVVVDLNRAKRLVDESAQPKGTPNG